MHTSSALTLMRGHSGSEKATNQRWLISATKQAISIKLDTTVGHFVRDFDFAKVCIAEPLVLVLFLGGDVCLSVKPCILITFIWPWFNLRGWLDVKKTTIYLSTFLKDRMGGGGPLLNSKMGDCGGGGVARLCCSWLSLEMAAGISYGNQFFWDNKVYKKTKNSTLWVRSLMDQRRMLSTTKQAIGIKLATTVGHVLRDLFFANVYMAWPPSSRPDMTFAVDNNYLSIFCYSSSTFKRVTHYHKENYRHQS